jgi:ribonuclease J
MDSARTSMANQEELVFLPLGGVGEIGMNLALYGYGPKANREWIMVDCGVTFAGPDLPGVDLVLPDIDFIFEERAKLRGIIITHAHEDHYGALSDLWPGLNCPVYVTPFAAGMLEAKRAYERTRNEVPVTVYKAGETFTVGPFSIEAVAVNHSIPEPVSLAITTPLGRVIHTGDWKIDEAPTLLPKTDQSRFQQLGDEGVLALICDSTNAMRDGVSPSEREVSASLKSIIEQAEGRVAITTFASNVGRIRSIAEAARDAGRQCLLLGSSIKRVVDVASDLGMMEGLPPFLAEDEYGFIPRDRIVIILTGSQGEPRAALAKISRDEMRHVALTAGDKVVFSSRTIPGNEKAILEIMNALIEQGIEIVTDGQALVHVSGHPRRSELQQMYQWVRPDILVPVHGEAAHLTAHAALASASGIRQVPRVRNGRMLRLAPGPAELVGEVEAGRLYKDGRLIGDFEEMAIGERRKLAFAGHVAVSFLLDARHELLRDPFIVTSGVPEMDDEGDAIVEMLTDAAIGAVDSVPRQRRKDMETVREAVRRAVRAEANRIWGKKPVTVVFGDRV